MTIDDCPALDLPIVPSSWGTRKEVKSNTLLKWIADRATKTILTASVCAGSNLLGKADLLYGREAHWKYM